MSNSFAKDTTAQQLSRNVHDGGLLAMGGGKTFPPTIEDRSAYVVEFDGPDDPIHPLNWPSTTRFLIAFVVCFGAFVATLDSALFAAGSTYASHHFSVVPEVGKLGTSLYVLGFAFGPLIWAPGSELIGRRQPLIVGMLGCSIFSFGSATAKNIQTLIISRFFAGLFGASPLCVVPAVLSDIYNDLQRGTAIAIYALAVFGGPFVAPFTGGFIVNSSLGWRWTLYLPAILGFVDAILLIIAEKETFPALVLVQKAAYIRKETGNWNIHAEHERLEVDAQAMIQKYFTRPLQILIMEPLVLVVSLYMSFIYGLVYALLEAYPYVFEQIHGMKPGVAGLPFIALLLGLMLALCFIILQQRYSIGKKMRNNGISVPEDRLPPTLVGAVLFPAGVFCFAWTAFNQSIPWIAPTLSGVLTGFGLLSIFLPCFNYLVDAYLPICASVVAANIILRSIIAAAFPLFSTQMFEKMGVQWAGTLLGCVAVAMMPVPFVLIAGGERLRKKSKLLSTNVEDCEKQLACQSS